MEEFDNDKKKEYLVTDLNSYLTYISKIKLDIKRSEGIKHETLFLPWTGQQRVGCNAWNISRWNAPA